MKNKNTGMPVTFPSTDLPPRPEAHLSETNTPYVFVDKETGILYYLMREKSEGVWLADLNLPKSKIFKEK